MSHFESLSLLPEDPILSIPMAFAADKHPHKVNLGIGAYKDAVGQSLVLLPVKEAEKIVIEQNLAKDYLPIEGNQAFIQETAKIILGPQPKKEFAKDLFGFQTIGGTSALRLGADLLALIPNQKIYLSHPTWPNHSMISKRAGLKVANYPYYSSQIKGVDFPALCQSIEKMESGSAILLQACCHNPTGADLSFTQWKILSELILKQELIPFFDVAYQGFGASMEEDVQAVRHFVEQGHELFIAYSYSKNMGLYGERLGAFFAIIEDEKSAKTLASHASQIVRNTYSNPPLFVARVATTILQTESLRCMWIEELNNMRHRIEEMRIGFVSELLSKSSDTYFEFIKGQKGMFSYTDLSEKQVQTLKNHYGIYLPEGRINIAGLNWNNMSYVVESLISVRK